MAKLIVAAVLAALCASAATAAELYPVKPVRIIVAVGAGGGDDFAARQVAAKLSELLGQQFFVENRPGAGGMIGQTFVAKSPPDGYTLLLAGGSMAGARYVNANMGYDLLRDFTPVSLIETSPFVLVANPALPTRSVSEFIALARSRPGKMTFGTLGAGQIPYWSVVLFNSMAGIEALEIQYKSPADAIVDIITGRLDYFFAPVISAVGNREKLRALAVTTRERADMLRDVPAMAEAALPAYEMPAWRSIMGPAGMSSEVVEILNRAIARSLESPEVRERFLKAGSVPTPSSPEELRKRYEDWIAIFGKIAKDAGIQPH
ncbi:MAG: tripartite tricarboxylate transporter substrate binding protein [Betaproteobacteria bacterium]|nr:MAG: tripartite tricarboxylate transporter substrate binding protein [Betaproteobacteria bacterium]